jgi:hypothetical protein
MTKSRLSKKSLPCQPNPKLVEFQAVLKSLIDLDINQLRDNWRSLSSGNAPPSFSRDLLARMIAYRLQEQQFGKLDWETKVLLDRLATGVGEPARRLKIGTTLTREHNGHLHEVIVMPNGFLWEQKTYSSLSAIARAITGTAWTGPRFFGLRSSKGRMYDLGKDLDVVPPSNRGARSSIQPAGFSAATGAAQ